MYVMLAVLMVNIAFIALFYPMLKVTTFDPEFAAVLGLPTRLLYTAFMFLVSVTVVAAFHAAGALLVISLLVVPAATALLISQRLSVMLALTAVFAVMGALAGFWIAYVLNAATSAGMALFYGLMFVSVALADKLAIRVRRERQSKAGSDERPLGSIDIGAERSDDPPPVQSRQAAE